MIGGRDWIYHKKTSKQGSLFGTSTWAYGWDPGTIYDPSFFYAAPMFCPESRTTGAAFEPLNI